MKKLLVAAMVVLMASPVFAAIQNVKVSGDITSTYLDRNDFDLGLDVDGVPTGLKKQSVFLTQTRLRVDADLTDHVSTTVGLINERAWNAEGSGDTNVQLYLASITLRELLYSPLTVTVGRQVFNYGNGLILGDGGAVNQGTGSLQNIAQDLTLRTAYDGVKATLDYKPLTIDLIYFKNGQTTNSIQGVYSQNGANSDVYGLNANYQLSDPYNTVLETYLFTRINGNTIVPQGPVVSSVTTPADKGDTLYVPGLRASTNPVKGLNIQGELAWQLGNHPVTVGSSQEAEHRDAMAAQVLASYSLPVLEKYKPTVNASYTYVSGDKNSAENYHDNAVKSAKYYSAWDEFNTIQGAGTIYRSIFPLSNQNIVALGASISPLQDVTAAVTWSGLWAADPYGNQNLLALYQPDGGATAIGPATKHDAYSLGNETDVNLTYNYTEDVTFGVNVGWYVPGTVLSNVNRSTASQAIANLAVKF
ncbi:MAG: alginate export family protein [Candidatus Omnitrophica bacterium]|nr:alginate export family protein [Candidatus Omnitrophota bacterium]